LDTNVLRATKEIDPEFPTVVVPYAKSQEQPEKISLLVFTQEEGTVEVTTLVPWGYTQVVEVSAPLSLPTSVIFRFLINVFCITY